MNSALLAQSSLRRTLVGREQMGCLCGPAGRAELRLGLRAGEDQAGRALAPPDPAVSPQGKGTGAERGWQCIL